MDVSIILVNYNGLSVLKHCLARLEPITKANGSEIIIVDNASEDDSVVFLKKEYSGITIIENPKNEGFGSACNIGAEKASGDYLLFLNPDTVLQEDIITPLVQYLSVHPDVGIVGPKFVHDDGTHQLSCGKLPSITREALDKFLYSLARLKFSPVENWLTRKYSKAIKVEWVTGAALMIRAHVFHSLSGFDETMFMYFEDKDLCKRARDLRWGVWFVPHVTVMHYLGKSSSGTNNARLRAIYRASQKYYYKKHHGVLQQWLLAFYHGVSS